MCEGKNEGILLTHSFRYVPGKQWMNTILEKNYRLKHTDTCSVPREACVSVLDTTILHTHYSTSSDDTNA